MKAMACHAVDMVGSALSDAEHLGEKNGDSLMTLVPGTERVSLAEHVNS